MKTALLFIALLSTITLYSQTQIGDDIDGEAANDESGSCVSLSSDGNTVAIGAPENAGNGNYPGHVRVYRNNSGVWNQIGNDIDGEVEDDESGSSVSLSSDGNTVAIGAPRNDDNGDYSGHVRVYRNNSGVWSQIGDDIDGEAVGDKSGSSVSLSSDGNTVAIGAPYNTGSGANSGHVRIYKNISDVWTQIGDDIDGEEANNYSGWSVSLSSDGTVVAIGAPENAGNGNYSGHVRVYKNNSDVWTQIGTDIDGEAVNDNSGISVSLSSDGNVVAIGAPSNAGNGNYPGHVRVYKNNSSAWTQIGNDIDGEASSEESGSKIALSADGNTVVIGSPWSNGNGYNSNTGQVRIYKNNSDVWTQIGDDVDGEDSGDKLGSSVSLSSDGSTVAVGAPHNAGNGTYSGHVRIYSLSILLGIENNKISENVAVHPNPINNYLQLQFESALKYKQAAIYNHLGQLIIESKSTTINVSALASGIYFLEIETNNGKGVKKIIKK